MADTVGERTIQKYLQKVCRYLGYDNSKYCIGTQSLCCLELVAQACHVHSAE